MTGRADHWTAGFFDEPYTELFPFPDAVQTDVEVDALVQLLPYPPAQVLDLACGQGRHSVRLAQRGYEVVGVDTSTTFLQAARIAATERAIEAAFEAVDMRDLDFDDEFDSVLSLFTAWGYFDDADNQDVLERIARSLRPGGRLIIDLIHRDWLMSVYEPEAWSELSDGSVAVATRAFDPVRGVNLVTQRWQTPTGEAKERRHELRIYTATELDHMLRHAHLVPIDWYGGFTLEAFSHQSRRMLVVAEHQP